MKIKYVLVESVPRKKYFVIESNLLMKIEKNIFTFTKNRKSTICRKLAYNSKYFLIVFITF